MPSAAIVAAEHLTGVIINYLNAQIDAGVQVVQLFDSWVGALGPSDYREFVLPHQQEVDVMFLHHVTGCLPPPLKLTGGDCSYQPLSWVFHAPSSFLLFLFFESRELLALRHDGDNDEQRRSLLTVLGIFIGIAAVVGLISISQGLRDAVNSQFEMMGTDMITIIPSFFINLLL
jgi:hypothetical protein